MSRLRPLALAALALLALCLGAGSAAAKTLSPTQDCLNHNGTLTQQYSVKQLRSALNAMSSSSKEYSQCYTTISDQLEQQLPKLHSHGKSSSGGGSGTLIIVIVIVVVLLAGGGGAFYAYRRNQQGPGGPAAP